MIKYLFIYRVVYYIIFLFIYRIESYAFDVYNNHVVKVSLTFIQLSLISFADD